MTDENYISDESIARAKKKLQEWYDSTDSAKTKSLCSHPAVVRRVAREFQARGNNYLYVYTYEFPDIVAEWEKEQKRHPNYSDPRFSDYVPEDQREASSSSPLLDFLRDFDESLPDEPSGTDVLLALGSSLMSQTGRDLLEGRANDEVHIIGSTVITFRPRSSSLTYQEKEKIKSTISAILLANPDVNLMNYQDALAITILRIEKQRSVTTTPAIEAPTKRRRGLIGSSE